MPELGGLIRELEGSGVPVRRCYGCRKCSGGCPISDLTERPPHWVVRSVQLGRTELVRGTGVLELCTNCGTCGVRCPNGIAVGEVINALRRRFGEPGRSGVLHRGFMRQVAGRGRVHGLFLAGRYVLETGTFAEHGGLGVRLWRHGKLRLRTGTPRGAARREVAALFGSGGGEGV